MDDRRPQSKSGSVDALSSRGLVDALELVDDVVFVLDGDAVIRGVNRAVESVLGYDRSAIADGPITALLAPPQSGTDHPTGRHDALFEGTASDQPVRFEAADDAVCRLLVSATRTADGEILWVCQRRTGPGESGTGEGTDTFDAIGDPVYVLDDDRTITHANQAMLDLTGYDRANVVGRKLDDLVPADETRRVTERLPPAHESDRDPVTFETELLTRAGDVVLAEVTVTRHAGGDGPAFELVCVFRDIRERKHREHTLSLLKQVLTRVFRHNVRNRLMTVQAHAEMLGDHGDDHVRKCAAEIHTATARLLGHTENARRIEAVLDADERTTVDLTSVVGDALDAVEADYPDATVETDLSAGDRVQAHSGLQYAVEELFRNALKHAPSVAATRVDVWIEERDGTTLFVEDESGGLDSHELDVLRAGSETDLEHGSGVGLWLVWLVVEYSGAELIVHRTTAGTIMGITFEPADGDTAQSEYSPATTPFAPTPDSVREVSPSQFRGETVIGRMELRQELETIYERLPQTGGHSVVVTGEAGIGKTTLIEQFRDRLPSGDDAPAVTAGACDPSVNAPYQPFRQVFADLPGDRGLGDIIADIETLEESDADDAETRKQALFADLASRLRDVATDRPVVVVVEDMHWADPGTVDLFEYLTDELGRWSHPVLFLCTYRRSDVEAAHPVLSIAEDAAETGRGTVFELDPFDTDEVAALLRDVLGLSRIPESFLAAVHDHTGGTPLFVAELAAHLVEAHGSFEDVAALPDLDVVTVPQTIEAAVAERLAALPARVEPTLELGAIIGESFSFDVLRAASEQSVEAVIEAVDTLVARGVWTRRADKVTFVHGVVREQTLTGIDDDARRGLHGRAAEAIETVRGDDPAADADRLATHYEAAGDSETAFGYYRAAGDVASEAFATEEAVDAYEHALSLADTDGVADDAEIAAVYADLAAVYTLVGDHDPASDAVDTGLDLASVSSAPRCRLLGVRGKIALSRSAYDEAAAAARQQWQLAASLDLASQEADAISRLGRVVFRRGAYDQARAYYKHSLAVSERSDDRSEQASSLHNLGVVAFRQAAYEEADDYLERALDIYDEVGDRKGQANVLNNLGVVALRRSAYDRARDYYEESLAIKREIGDRQGQASCLNNLGLVEKSRGAYDRARDYYEESLAIKREVGDRQGVANSLGNLGIVAQATGDYERADDYHQRSLDIYEEIGDRQGEARTLENLGVVARYRGAYAQARDYHQRSQTLKSEIGDRRGIAASLQKLGVVARHCGAYDQARDYVQRSLDRYEELDDRLGRAASLIESATVARRTGEYETARETLDRAATPLPETDDPETRIDHARECAALARHDDAYDQAAENLTRARDACDTTHVPRKHVQVTLEQARLALARDSTDAARETVEQARLLLAELEAPLEAANATVLEGRVAAASGDSDTAVDRWHDAVDTFDELGTPQHALRTLDRLVTTAREVGDLDTAREACQRARALLETAPPAVVEIHREWVDRQTRALNHQNG